MTKGKLYALVLITCLAGYVWLFFSYFIMAASAESSEFTVCLIKQLTDIPCPSCGITRSVKALIQGEWAAAIYWNPLGILVFGIMVLSPLWISLDLMLNRSGFFSFYQKSEQNFQKKPVAIIAMVLILLNWIWNINKGL